MRWADVYVPHVVSGVGRPDRWLGDRQVDAMGRRLRSPRLPGVDVPSGARRLHLRPGPAAGPMAERWLSLSWWWACESRRGRSRRGSGRCSGLSVVRDQVVTHYCVAYGLLVALFGAGWLSDSQSAEPTTPTPAINAAVSPV